VSGPVDLKASIKSDPEIAWAWHCNIAVPLMDSLKLSHERANIAAAYLMSHLFDVDTTASPHFHYKKGPHQSMHEFLMHLDGR
jgi:hypothetical protein